MFISDKFDNDGNPCKFDILFFILIFYLLFYPANYQLSSFRISYFIYLFIVGRFNIYSLKSNGLVGLLTFFIELSSDFKALEAGLFRIYRILGSVKLFP